MKSILRFLIFLMGMAVGLAAVQFLRTTRHAAPDAVAPDRSVLEIADREFTDLVARTLPCVVSIDALAPDAGNPHLRMLRYFLGGQVGVPPPQLGSGVIVSSGGHVVTNHHVIEGAGAIQVHLSDGRTLPARVLGADRRSDIAVLQIEGDGLQPARWGDSDRVRIGQRVFAVGNPLGLQETVTQGIISGKGRRTLSEAANEFFQTDAAINRGNSGGPLLDMQGELIGMTNMVTVGSEGIAFAIPSNVVRRVFEGIRDHGQFIRPWFGGVMRALTPGMARQLGLTSTQGALLLGAYEDSPAAAAGFLPGDVIVSLNGKPVTDHIDLRNRIAECAMGDTITLGFIRRGAQATANATIAAEPQELR